MTASERTFKAAVVQAAPVFLDRDGTIEKGVSYIKDAAKAGANLIAFPEVWIPGYPWWIWLGAPAWGMQFVPRYHENSLSLNSPQVELITEAAKENDIHVVVGYSEKAGGSLFMGQMIIDRAGNIVATRRKLKPTHAERTVFGEGDGSHLAVHELDIGRLVALNCWEHLQPLTKYAMYSMNEEIHFCYLPISVRRTERPICDWMVGMKNRAAVKPMPAAIMNIPRKPNKSARNPRETPAEITPISKAP